METTHVTVEGRCLCGEIRYQVEGERSGIIACHCQRCRKHMGSAFASFIVFESGEFQWLAGKEMLNMFPGPVEGRAFCRTCGASMPEVSSGGAKMIDILAGNCLEMTPAALIYHFYTGSKSPWYEIPAAAHQWETVDADFSDPGLGELNRYTEAGKITGSCLCGEVAFEASEPLMMMNCHCTRCRLSRASAHATNLFVSTENFRWRSGAANVVNYKLPDAERFGTAFCRKCGSLVPRISSTSTSGHVNIPAGCLDSDPGIEPRGHIFTDSKAPWFDIEDELPRWATTPR